jgi:heat shock protein HtpX
VLGHELTHIRNGDVQLMVVAVIIAGVVGFFGELFFRMFTNLSWNSSGRRLVVLVFAFVFLIVG